MMQQQQRQTRTTMYTDNGRIASKTFHPYYSDVVQIKNTFDHEAYAAREAKLAKDFQALKVKLKHSKILYDIRNSSI